MKIVIAPDAFKESLTADEAAGAIRDGVHAIIPSATCVCVALADGGEGTVETLVAAADGQIHSVMVTGPCGEPVNARYGVLDDGRCAVIELASASGLALVPRDRRNPLETTSFGTGELILATLNGDLERLVIGIGGSATNDGGAGLCQALGVDFYDTVGRKLSRPIRGGDVDKIAAIDVSRLDARLGAVHIEVASDVDNPLLGPRGASTVFGPQKGADEATATALDNALARFYATVETTLGCEVVDVPGAGAAGGVGAALMAFLGARLRPGVDVVMEATKLDAQIADADVVITAEGCLDAQTLHGKLPAGVARLAAKFNVPVVAIGGSVADDFDIDADSPFAAILSTVMRPMPLAEALSDPRRRLMRTGMHLGQWLRFITTPR